MIPGTRAHRRVACHAAPAVVWQLYDRAGRAAHRLALCARHRERTPLAVTLAPSAVLVDARTQLPIRGLDR